MNMSRHLRHMVTGLVMFTATLMLAPNASAGPCEGLAESDPEAFEELKKQLDRASNRSEAADYDEAARAYLESLKLCDDFGIQYNVARMYQKAGQCRKAKTWFENVIERLEGEDKDSRAHRIVGLSRDYLADLEKECPETASIRARCAQPGVRVALDSGKAQSCPYQWEVEPGSHIITARKEGFEERVEQFDASKGQEKTIDIEPLDELESREPKPEAPSQDEEEVGSPQKGTLVVRCRGEFENVRVVGDSVDRKSACGETLSLPPGPYRVSGGDEVRKADIAAGVQSEVELGRSRPAGAASDGSASADGGFVLGARLSSGVAMVRGELYDRQNESFDRPPRLDGLQPSLPHLAVIGEVGWRFGRHFSALVRPRLDVVNPSVQVAAIARFDLGGASRLSAHVDVGGGYGQLLSPVKPAGDEEIYLDRSGTLLGVAGLGLAWRFSTRFAAVLQGSANVGIPQFGAIFDIGSLGIQGTL